MCLCVLSIVLTEVIQEPWAWSALYVKQAHAMQNQGIYKSKKKKKIRKFSFSLLSSLGFALTNSPAAD